MSKHTLVILLAGLLGVGLGGCDGEVDDRLNEDPTVGDVDVSPDIAEDPFADPRDTAAEDTSDGEFEPLTDATSDGLETDGLDVSAQVDDLDRWDVEPVACVPGDPPDRPLDTQPDDVFLKGPYLQNVTETSIVVMWQSEWEGLGRVEYGLTDELGQTAEEGTPADLHEIQLADLQPDTRYAYRVYVGAYQSQLHHFWTAPAPGSPIRFILCGDSQDNPQPALSVFNSMIPFDPYLVMHVGDTVGEGLYEPDWQNQFFSSTRTLAHEVPFFVAIGNHERDSPLFYEYFSFPHPSDDPQHESYYSFVYGNTFFLVMDTNKLFVPLLDYLPPQLEWIMEQLDSSEAQSATWRLAYAHHPGYSEAWSPGNCSYDGSPAVREVLFPLLIEHGFHAYFSGHTHDYERGMVDGLLTIITGGGGGGLDEWCRDWETTTVVEIVHHHLRVQATCDELDIEAVDVDGTTIDHVVLRADSPGTMFE